MGIIRPNADMNPTAPKASRDECCMERPYPIDKGYGHSCENPGANVQYSHSNAGYPEGRTNTGVPIPSTPAKSANKFFGIKGA